MTAADGRPVSDALVGFSPVTSGSVSVSTARSNASGVASTTWTLGEKTGANRLFLSTGNLPAIEFVVTTTAGPPASLTKVDGDNQTSITGAELPRPLTVRVSDAFGNAVPGYTLPASAVTVHGAGTLSGGPPSNAAGLLSLGAWTLGKTAGVQDVTVAGPGEMSVQFTATAVTLVLSTVVAGNHHTCGLDPRGAAWCWGGNSFGELGIGRIDATSQTSRVPLPVVGGLAFVELAAGGFWTCGRTSAGAAYCWGFNRYGQLGDGDTTSRGTPTAVAGGLTFARLAAGFDHACALTAAGAAYCWGHNWAGQLGAGTRSDVLAGETRPVAVVGGHTFASLAGGLTHTCGLVTNGAAYCWGYNQYAQLGTGDTAQVILSAPNPVAGGHRFVTIGVGYEHTCAVATDGVTYCWGNNTAGQLGVGKAEARVVARWATPTAIPGDVVFSAVAGGADFTCGATAARATYCWGGNRYGQLATGDTLPRYAPAPVVGGLTFEQITTGAVHACGLVRDGTAFCWGSNSSGALAGGGAEFARPVPGRVNTP